MHVGCITPRHTRRSLRTLVEGYNYDDSLKNRVATGFLALLAPEVILAEAFGNWVHSCEDLNGKQV